MSSFVYSSISFRYQYGNAPSESMFWQVKIMLYISFFSDLRLLKFLSSTSHSAVEERSSVSGTCAAVQQTRKDYCSPNSPEREVGLSLV